MWATSGWKSTDVLCADGAVFVGKQVCQLCELRIGLLQIQADQPATGLRIWVLLRRSR